MKSSVTITFEDLQTWAALQRESILDFVAEAQPEELPASFVADLAHAKALSNLLDALQERQPLHPLVTRPQVIELEL